MSATVNITSNHVPTIPNNRCDITINVAKLVEAVSRMCDMSEAHGIVECSSRRDYTVSYNNRVDKCSKL